jgi:hypothetical protein
MRRQIFLLKNLESLEFGELDVPGIFQDQRFGAIANHDPFAVLDQQC